MKLKNAIGLTDGKVDARVARMPLAPGQKNDKRLQFTLEGGTSGSAVVMHCRGRIISSSEARSLSTIVAEVLPSARRMVIDLAEIDSVDSGGLGELVLAHMWAEAAGYSLKIASPPKTVRHPFAATHLVSGFALYA